MQGKQTSPCMSMSRANWSLLEKNLLSNPLATNRSHVRLYASSRELPKPKTSVMVVHVWPSTAYLMETDLPLPPFETVWMHVLWCICSLCFAVSRPSNHFSCGSLERWYSPYLAQKQFPCSYWSTSVSVEFHLATLLSIIGCRLEAALFFGKKISAADLPCA